MLHRIPVDRLGPAGERMAAAVQACVHCGFCLASCPTYLLLGEEMDSPRGRIYLMKQALEGELPLWGAVARHVDRCLGCLACVSACPSGVHYGELLTGFRAHLQSGRRPRGVRGLLRRALMAVLPYPARFRMAAAAGRLARPLRGVLPRWGRAALELVPAATAPSAPLPARVAPQGRRRARVALLAGCVQSVLEPEINHAALRVLSRNGVEVVVPTGQGCCGALSMHVGMADHARKVARRDLAAFEPKDVDAIVTTAAGCGSAMKEYPLLFAGEPEEPRARDFAARVKDISEFLDALGIEPPGELAEPTRVAYHDACHLAHGQGIREAPRRLLSAIGNVQLAEIAEGEICCGSAGVYNLEHPELAGPLGERKVEHILATGASVVATGNIGCMVQIAAGLSRRGSGVRVMHTIQLLDLAYRRAGREPVPAAFEEALSDRSGGGAR